MFPVGHVTCLSDAIICSLESPGYIIVSNQVTTLQEIAQTLRRYADPDVPAAAPLWSAKLGEALLESISQVTYRSPLMAQAQIESVSKGWEPKSDTAKEQLEWHRHPLDRDLPAIQGKA